MNDDPESNPGEPTSSEIEAGPSQENGGEPLTSTTQVMRWPEPQQPLATLQPSPVEPIITTPPRPPRLIPHIGHFAVFLLLLIPSFVIGYAVVILGVFAGHPHGGFGVLLGRLARMTKEKNLLFAMSMQAAWYGAQWFLTALVFGVWWKTVAGIGFARGIHWNAATAKRWVLILAGIGVATGFLVSVAGNFVPMPKAPPILQDLTESRAGAWFLMAFGVTLAPLTEELAFRGFLLPGLINIFRWLQRNGAIGESAVRYAGIPLCIVLTSIPFALMHAAQVSDSWGPVLLIGCVSIVLCIVRLRADSVACSIIVHAFYNLTLFSGLLIQTDGFRHLDKLKG